MNSNRNRESVMKFNIDFKVIEDAVLQVEAAYGMGGGTEKRKAAVALINAAVDLPILPESLEGILIGLLVDLTVHIYNRLRGRFWLREAGEAGASHA